MAFIKDIDVCNDYNILAERWKLIDEVSNTEKVPKRGQRRLMNFYEESAGDFEMPTYMGTFEEKKDDIKPIDFKPLIDREKDKKKVIYGLFDSILDANLDGIKDIMKDNYTVEIIYKIGGANILCIRDDRTIGERCCYIKYENVNPHKSFGYTREEIEEYLQRIVIAFVMEYDK